MDGVITASMRRTRTTALLATVLCAFALLAPTTAKAVTGEAHTGIQLVKAVAAGSAHHHVLTAGLDQPHAISTGSEASIGWAVAAATATSATITPSRTADSPRMRGPPAHGCC